MEADGLQIVSLCACIMAIGMHNTSLASYVSRCSTETDHRYLHANKLAPNEKQKLVPARSERKRGSRRTHR